MSSGAVRKNAGNGRTNHSHRSEQGVRQELRSTQGRPSLQRGASISASAGGVSASRATAARASSFKAKSAVELQELDIWRIVACLPTSSFAEVKLKILGLSRDQTFAMNYWVKVCKLRATRGLPMPWDPVH